MKHRSLILGLALTALLLLTGCRSKYASLSHDFDNIEAVRIPRIALWITRLPITSIDAMSCEGMNGRAEVLRAADQAVAKAKSELLLEVTELDEEVRIYANIDARKNKVKNLIIISANANSLDFVTLRGSFSLADLPKSGINLRSLIGKNSSASISLNDDDDD